MRRIDRVTLRNDLLQQIEVLLCEEGQVAVSEGNCITAAPVDLYESSVLDRNDDIVAAPGFFPVYQDAAAQGRALRAEDFERFVAFFQAQNRDIRATDDRGRTLLDIVRGHGKSEPFVAILEKAGG
mgnify:CR=1 FL=1